jgi:membrane protein
MRSSTFRGQLKGVTGRLRGGFLGACLERSVAMDASQHAIALASQAFTAGIPFAIVFAALTPGNRDAVERLISRFHIRGSTADQVRSLFLSGTDVQGAVTWIGVIFLLVAVISMAASLQRVYERAMIVPHIGLRARWRTVVWLLGASVYIEWFIVLKPNVYEGGTNIARALLSVVGSFVFWLWTPRILLGPRASWRRFVPVAGFTTIAVTLLELATPLYMPKMITDDAARFGMIGVAFSLVSWLFVLAFLIVGSAVVASELGRRRLSVTGTPERARQRDSRGHAGAPQQLEPGASTTRDE